MKCWVEEDITGQLKRVWKFHGMVTEIHEPSLINVFDIVVFKPLHGLIFKGP
ncbi:hypothetical protein DPMN_081546 [Dreissena polymorpha]|uniref:Uncharacterized protein n=1 Tax=Dreissena polymorpha TaxID=45954 RepID=A0A9D3Y6I5_DREPO|nr:hypothetical protein DPMN_081546 [Dreissena polymorpha]